MAYNPKRKNYMMSKAKYSKFKTDEKNYDYGLIDKRTNEIVASPEKLIEYLEFQSRMDRYTVSNAMLIMSRCPEASQLKEESEWNKLNISVKEGVEKIHVLEPVKYFKDGKAQMNTNVKYVYDISQTNALPDPEKPKKYDDRTLVSALLATAKIEKVVAKELPIEESCAFYDSENNQLVIKEKGGSGTKLFQDIARELTLSEIAYNSDEYNRSECEFSAECSVYMICKKYGIDTQGLNLNSVPKEWENKENKDIRLNLTMARDSLNTIGSRMYAVLNRDKEPKQQEQSR